MKTTQSATVIEFSPYNGHTFSGIITAKKIKYPEGIRMNNYEDYEEAEGVDITRVDSFDIESDAPLHDEYLVAAVREYAAEQDSTILSDTIIVR